MTIEEILNELRVFNPRFPQRALSEAIDQREAVIPHLLDALDYINDHTEELWKDDAPYYLHIYALYLLAQFREKRAFPKVIRLISHESGDMMDYLIGDILTENCSAILCSTFNGEWNLLDEVIENKALYEYCRTAALKTYSFLAQRGLISRAELIDYFRRLMYERLTDEGKPSAVLTAIISEAVDWHLTELIPDVRHLYAQGAVDMSIVGNYDSFINHIFDYHYSYHRSITIDDTIAERRDWACYDKDASVTKKTPKKPPVLPEPSAPSPQKKKIGRNDPCPCGSGKKYKHCCMNKPAPLANLLKKEPGGQDLAAKAALALPKPPQKDTNPLKSLFDTGPYDLMTGYPDLKAPVPDGAAAFGEYFSPQGIEIDIPVYQALHRRPILFFTKRDECAEDLERIDLLSAAFDRFTDCCNREAIPSFNAFDEKYMVHYYSSYWVQSLRDLLTDYQNELPEEKLHLLTAVSDLIERMSVN